MWLSRGLSDSGRMGLRVFGPGEARNHKLRKIELALTATKSAAFWLPMVVSGCCGLAIENLSG